ncbi:MAG: alpha/beta hydrolase [Legionellales bacterium]|nr:alpha/beta hydrolase [Legionellales bacterium]
MGEPIFYFHGFPGSRFEAAPFDQIAQAGHYRLIGIDRPGMGLSTPEPNRTLLSWVDDIVCFANVLNIDTFSIIGHSGGTPFAAACAYQIPQRLKGVAIVSGMAPLDNLEANIGMPMSRRLVNGLIKTFPCLITPMLTMTQRMLKKPDGKMMQQMLKQLPTLDQAVFNDSDYRAKLISGTLEAFRQGKKGLAQEMKLLFKPWGFELEKITCPITVWHGSLDIQAPLSHAQIYANLISQVTLKILPDEGHHSILKNHIAEIMDCLVTTTNKQENE